jgi:predicted TIM-barrel fold metal-dependent hydrolase
MHLGDAWGFDNAEAVEAARRIGIDQFCASNPATGPRVEPKAVRTLNNAVLKAMRRFPETVLGYCYVNPGWVRETQDEITRCIVDSGMMGIKLYHQYAIDEPVLFPVIERCIDLGVPILMHASYCTDAAECARQPRMSNAEHFFRAAQRYPDALLIHGHLPGGGDWEWGIKWLRKAPTVYVDTSGSVIDQGMIERMARELGAERLLFGTDMQYERGVGKVLDACLTERERRLVFGENMARVLARRKR